MSVSLYNDQRDELARNARAVADALKIAWRSIPGGERARICAELFCDMDDDAQAQVFSHAAEIASKWPGGNPQMQWLLVGEHLATCACATDGGRQMIVDLHYFMTAKLAEPAEKRA